MGDTGSMFIGYIIAAVSITGALKSAAAVTIFVPMLALAIPILDTTFAIIRRIFNDRPIGEADHGHIHHRLLAIGMNQRQAVISVYIISAILGTIAFVINGIKFDHALIIFTSVILIIIYGAKRLGIFSVELPQEGCSLEDS
jgi:UDP-GlcNAc:undecaprenyl-phosphate GlcNAc-1-phosphate transferase